MNLIIPLPKPSWRDPFRDLSATGRRILILGSLGFFTLAAAWPDTSCGRHSARAASASSEAHPHGAPRHAGMSFLPESQAHSSDIP